MVQERESNSSDDEDDADEACYKADISVNIASPAGCTIPIVVKNCTDQCTLVSDLKFEISEVRLYAWCCCAVCIDDTLLDVGKGNVSSWYLSILQDLG